MPGGVMAAYPRSAAGINNYQLSPTNQRKALHHGKCATNKDERSV